MKKKVHLLISLIAVIFLAACGLLDDNNEVDGDTGAPEEVVKGTAEEEVEPEPEPEPVKKVVSFYGVGDNNFHRQLIEDGRVGENEYDFTPFYENVRADIENADLAFVNQESIIGGDHLGLSGYPTFNSPEALAGDLVEVGFNIINGSNNHALDKGVQGLLNTIDIWSAFEDDALFTGVFNSQEARDEIPVIEIDDVTFSVLAYTYSTNGIPSPEPYYVNYFDPELITNDVERAKELSDFVIVAAHWGDEYTLDPNAMQLEYAQLFADLEVDMVIGSHPHSIHPMEWVEGENGNETLVVYSTGNFMASYPSDISALGGAISVDFVNEGEEYYLENAHFEPLVIHFTEPVPGALSTRENFKVHKLSEYTPDLAAQHGINNYSGSNLTMEFLEGLVTDTIDAEFLD